MKGNRFNTPDTRPLDRAAFFFGKALAGGVSFLIHGGENASIEVALIESSFAAADNSSNDSREGLDAAHGADGVAVLPGDGADFECEFGGGGQGIVADIHWRGTGVRFLAVEGDSVALDTFRA